MAGEEVIVVATHFSAANRRSWHLDPWLVVVVLAAALVGLGAWVIVDQTGSRAAPPPKATGGLASAKVVALLDARFSALNSGGKESFTRFYSPDTEITDFGVRPPTFVKGRASVATLMHTYSRVWAMAGQRVTRESPVIQLGNYVAHAVLLGPTPGIAVYKLDESGKIASQWVFMN